MIITIISQKGEQAKTSTAVSFAAACYDKGKSVSLIDIDTQQYDASKFKAKMPQIEFFQQWQSPLPSTDIIIVDTSNVINPDTIFALENSDMALIPVSPLPLSIDSLARTFETIHIVREKNPNLIARVLFTQTDRKPFTDGVISTARKLAEWPVAEATIPKTPSAFQRSSSVYVPVVWHARKSAAAAAYRELADELIP